MKLAEFKTRHPEIYEEMVAELNTGNGTIMPSNPSGTITKANCDEAGVTTEDQLGELSSILEESHKKLSELIQKQQQKTEGDINITINTASNKAMTRTGILRAAFKQLRNTRRGREP
jgi:hypothetical protein